MATEKHARTGTVATGLRPVREPTAILAALFCFSAGPIGIAVQKLLVASFTPFVIIALQMSIGAGLLWLAQAAFPKVGVSRAAVVKGLVLGALHPGAFMIVFTAASARLDSVTAVLLVALVPALVAIGGWLLLKETLKPVVLIGIGVSLAGLALLVSERQVTGENELTGFALGVLGLALAAGGVITGRAFNTGAMLPWHLLAPLQVTGAASVAWAGVLFQRTPVDLAAVMENWVAFAYLAIGMTAASYFAYNFALSRLPTPTIGLIAAAGPGAGAVAAALIFGTVIESVAALGILVILGGAAVPPITAVVRARIAGNASRSSSPPKRMKNGR